MIQFSVKFPASRPSPVGREFYHFATCGSKVLLAGSRHGELDNKICAGLLSAFFSRGASFVTGCAKGVDLSFRRSLAEGGYHAASFVACAFNRAADKMDLPAKKVVKDGLPASVALAKRTVWMCGEADLLVLFPSDPIGPGSSLALKIMIQANKPVFVVTGSEPEPSPDYDVYPSGLFGLVTGFWLLPHVYPSRSSGTTREVKQSDRLPEEPPKQMITKSVKRRSVSADPGRRGEQQASLVTSPPGVL